MRNALNVIFLLSFIFLIVALWNGNTDYILKDLSILLLTYLLNVAYDYFDK